jgi:5-hydroxyisourate hydrolase
MRLSLSTHVLDATAGRPAAGVAVRVEHDGATLVDARTDDDGRIHDHAPLSGPGTYRITFATGASFAATGQQGFYPAVTIAFTVSDPAAHHHIPLLLSPYSYTTYKGS